MKKYLAAAAAVIALGCVGAAHADNINFAQFGADGTGLGNSVTGTTTGGVGFTLIGPGSGFTILGQCPGPPACGWSGNFPNATSVLYDNGVSGPVTIDFNTPISSISELGVEANLFGPYTATLQAYDGMTLVGTDTVSSVSAYAPGTVVSFNFSSPTITSIVISTTDDYEGFGLGGSGGTGGYDVPEPATWAMLLVGFGAIGAAMRSSRRRNSIALA